MMDHMSTMKTEMSSKLSAILAILTNFQEGRAIRFEDQAKSMEIEKEMANDADVDVMEVYH